MRRATRAAGRSNRSRARVLLGAGDLQRSRAIAQAVLADAAATPAISAEAQVIVGVVERQLGDFEAAARRLADTYYFAGRVGAELVAAEAAVVTMAVVGTNLSRHDAGLEWGRSAEMMIGRLGLAEQELGARYLVTLGVIHRQRGAPAEALTAYERARAIFRADLGPGHPSVARVLNNIGSVYNERGDFTAALARYTEALAIFEDVYGPEHPDVAVFLTNIGACLTELKRRDEARAALERALRIDTATHGPDNPRVAAVWANLGALALQQEDFTRALADFDRARAIHAARPESRELASIESGRGTALQRLGRAEEAIASFERALTLSATFDIPAVAPQAAIPLARLLWTTGGDRTRAHALAESARAAFVANPAEAQAAAEATRWLAEHPIPR